MISGSNKFASQRGMSIGAVRHVSDIKSDDMTQEGQGILNLQSGTNKFASQKGMSMGAVRHVSDIRADDMSQESHGLINLQAGMYSFLPSLVVVRRFRLWFSSDHMA